MNSSWVPYNCLYSQSSTQKPAIMAFIPPPFEGPEKLLEVWFAPSPDALPSSSSSSLKPGRSCGDGQQGEYRGLRRVPRAVWEEMLDIVKCKVLSVVEGDEVDAYLLR
jgi:S-adenosylmethionine decarboxylase